MKSITSPDVPKRCRRCNKPLRMQTGRGRPQVYCRSACRQAAYEDRQRAAALPPAPEEDRSDWHTPVWLRAWLFARWYITFDACATRASALAELYAGPDRDDGLRNALDPDVDWGRLAGLGGVVYVCPPFLPIAELEAFLAKCAMTARAGTTVVAVVPSQDGNDWWDPHITLAGAAWSTIVRRFPFAGPHARGGTPRWNAAVVEWPGWVQPIDPDDHDAHHERRTLGRIVAPSRPGAGATDLTIHHTQTTAAGFVSPPRETGLIVPVDLDPRHRALGLMEFSDADLDRNQRLVPGDRLLLSDQGHHLRRAVIETITPGATGTRYRARFPH